MRPGRGRGGLVAVAAAAVVLLAGETASGATPECDGLTRTGADGSIELAQACGTVDGDLGARAAAGLAKRQLAPALGIAAPDLSAIDVARSPGGRAVRFQQSIGGVPVFDGQVVISLGDDNRVDMVLSSAISDPPPDLEPALAEGDALALAIAQVDGGLGTRVPPTAELVVFPRDTGLVLAWHVTVPTVAPVADWNVFLDADSGAVVAIWNGIAEVNGTAQVFAPNPFQKTNGTTAAAFDDAADADSAALTAARSGVTLTNLGTANNKLVGDFANLSAPGINGPLPYNPGLADEPTREYAYTRMDDRFEEATVYHAITEAQKLIQSLGFNAANNRSVSADVHNMSADNSNYSSVDKALRFGDGGVDDAEDVDIVLHEYGHSIHDNQVPGWGPGSNTEQRAIGEGFGDLFAGMFYMGSGDPTYEASARRYCIGEWDADSYNPINASSGSGCLRWINGRSEGSGADIGAYGGSPTQEHNDGRYWSAAMTCIFEGLGGDQAARNLLLRLVLDSHTRLLPTSGNTAFEDQVASMLVSDRNLFSQVHQALIRSCASTRNIANLPEPPPLPTEPTPTEPTPTDPTPEPQPTPDVTAPDTTLRSGPENKTRRKRADFEFSANEDGARFECSLDDAPFAACTSPHSVKVKLGKHTLEVRAIDTAGNVDATPASDSWKVKRKPQRRDN